MRRRRLEDNVELRKNKREEIFEKRRNLYPVEKEENISATFGDIANNFTDLNLDLREQAIITVKKLLSPETDYPDLIESGIIPILVECLNDDR